MNGMETLFALDETHVMRPLQTEIAAKPDKSNWSFDRKTLLDDKA